MVSRPSLPKDDVLLPELPQLTDIAPTVHHWLNLPVPAEFHSAGFRVGQLPSPTGAAHQPEGLKPSRPSRRLRFMRGTLLIISTIRPKLKTTCGIWVILIGSPFKSSGNLKKLL